MPIPPPKMPVLKNATMKTERTHEENQERAYIAASRRSDRSLEARVESARRASEIHKRRTGRALRVTEQDVLNEEMYEEEEDDLPLPYRQLTQHLTTGSAEFNRRLAAYLTNHVAVRSALDQIIRESHNLSANAAAAAPGGFYSAPGGDSAMQQNTFSPSMFAPPFQSPITFSHAQTNPPVPSTMTQQQQQQPHPAPPQITMAQLQSSGTQFHIGPLGLSTVPQPNYHNPQFIRRQTTPQLQIPQQQQQVMNPNPYQTLSPQQLLSLNQAQSFQRSADGEMIVSPMSDTTMLSPQTASSPAIPAVSNMESPEMLHSRRMSIPAKVSTSPVQTQPPRQPSSAQSNPKSAAATPTSKPKKQASKQPEGKTVPQSTALKRKASDESPQDQPAAKSAKLAESRMNLQFTPPNVSLSLLDLSLPQNAQDLLYGGFNMMDPISQSMMMAGMNATHMELPLKLDDSLAKNKPFSGIKTQTISSTTPPNEVGMFNFQTGEYDLSSMMETGVTTFGTSFSKFDNFEYGNVDELWQDFFSSDNFNRESQEPPSLQDHNPEAES